VAMTISIIGSRWPLCPRGHEGHPVATGPYHRAEGRPLPSSGHDSQLTISIISSQAPVATVALSARVRDCRRAPHHCEGGIILSLHRHATIRAAAGLSSYHTADSSLQGGHHLIIAPHHCEEAIILSLHPALVSGGHHLIIVRGRSL